MPYQESDYFETPPKHKKIWRYMSIDKFMSMLYEESLYFPNVILFEDRDEGRLSHKTLLEEVCKTNLLNEENTPIKKDKAFREMQSFIEKAREFHEEESLNYLHSFATLLKDFSNHLMYCSCWFLRETESHSMWAEYGDKRHPTSIAIQTTVRDLIESIELTPYQIHIGEIKYKDYKKDHIEGYENFLSKKLNCHDDVLELFYAPVLHKRNIYKDEHEVRAIISFESICENHLDRIYTSEIPFYSDQLFLKQEEIPLFKQYDTNLMKDIPREGIPVRTILKKLIKSVVMSPNYNNYFYDPLIKLIKNIGLDPDIVSFSDI